MLRSVARAFVDSVRLSTLPFPHNLAYRNAVGFLVAPGHLPPSTRAPSRLIPITLLLVLLATDTSGPLHHCRILLAVSQSL